MTEPRPEGAPPSATPRVIVVMPAYNAERTLVDCYNEIPPGVVSETILVDDASADATVLVASTLPVTVIRHPHNVGYGGNQKTCYAEALRRGADVVIMLHPDGQYDARVIPELVNAVVEGRGDVVLGSRFLPPGDPMQGGMPRYKILANRILTGLENLALGLQLSEYHTGFRAYSRRFLQTIPFMRNSNDFVFDSQVLFQARHFGFRFHEVSVETRYFPEASSVDFRTSVIYGSKTLFWLLRYLLHRLGLWRCDLFMRPGRPHA